MSTAGEQINDEPVLARILSAKTIAIVGLSPDSAKPSNTVASYLISRGKTVIPVNPNHDSILGLNCYKSLLDIPSEFAKTIEIIDVFRKSQDIPRALEDAIELRKRNANGNPSVFWMQLGIINERAAQRAMEAGFSVAMDRCTKIEYMRLSGVQ